jgi:hypothetical protein
MLVGDEMARWESRDTAANPAREVMGSMRPTMATQDLAFEVCSSSPWGTDDYHAELFDLGEDAHQCVSFAPTWLANPTISEARTHELEPDVRIWSREYAAIPGATVSAALDSLDVAIAFELIDEPRYFGRTVCAIDASSLRGDGFCWLLAAESSAGLLIAGVDGIEGDELRRHSMQSIVDRIAAACKEAEARQVFGDQREAASLECMFPAAGVSFTSYAWSEPSKDEAMQLLRRLLRERKLHIEEHAKLKAEMLACKAHLMPSGRVKYATNGLDFLSALVTLMHAATADEIKSEPIGPRQYSAPEEHVFDDSRWAGMPGRGF